MTHTSMPINRDYYNIIDISRLITLGADINGFLVNGSKNEASETLLGKILSSVKQDLTKASVQELSKQDNVKLTSTQDCLVLSFGLHPRQFQLQIDNRPYGLRKVGNTTYIFSRSLGDLPDRPEERKALWMSLKKYHGLV